MTEQEWLSSDDPARLLEYMQYRRGDHTVGAALERRAAPLVSDRKLRLWVEACRETWGGGGALDLDHQLHDAVAVWSQSKLPRQMPESATRAALVREIVGNVFRPVVTTANEWGHRLRWNDGAIPKMAQAIYDARTFDQLPILADALEDAGCDNFHMLAHLRNGWPDEGPHVRGCWVLDLLLGKS